MASLKLLEAGLLSPSCLFYQDCIVILPTRDTTDSTMKILILTGALALLVDSFFIPLKSSSSDRSSTAGLSAARPPVVCWPRFLVQTNREAALKERRRRSVLQAGTGFGAPPPPSQASYGKKTITALASNFKKIRSSLPVDNMGAVNVEELRGLISDVYLRVPGDRTWWFCGKIAYCGCSGEDALDWARAVISEHGRRLRPNEFGNKATGDIEFWLAPGDSEIDVAYNRPHIQMSKVPMAKVDANNNCVQMEMVGFEPEIYVGGEEGFRTERTEDGLPTRSEVKSPNESELEGKKMVNVQAKDINR